MAAIKKIAEGKRTSKTCRVNHVTSTCARPRSRGSKMNRLYKPLLIIGIAFGLFLGGAFVVLTKVFPYEYLDKSYVRIVAAYERYL